MIDGLRPCDGSAVTTVALPLVAISTLRAGPAMIALLTAATWLPWLLIITDARDDLRLAQRARCRPDSRHERATARQLSGHWHAGRMGMIEALPIGVLRPMPWGPPGAADLPQSVRHDLAAIVLDLVQGRYPLIERYTEGSGWSAGQLRAAVTAHPIPLAVPPQRIPPDLTSTVDGPHRLSRMTLWDTIHGPSRLRLEVVHDAVGHRITWLGSGDPERTTTGAGRD
jgi:hypothetical protein